MRNHGRVTAWKGDKGYGFIESDAGGPQIFLYTHAFAGLHRPAGSGIPAFLPQ